ncbi:hypothetical protein B0T20DRAFT_390180 [Sordaria brevicollis]|uniref:Uncharacterized protein n=1 Tax=Sordaria brevicollis TaxID=83679 RepID=A0AAE0PLN7_SORBR|nr:hypothetical protein B0T20DRAFT_390180 [Sordaria brevicollis]
MGSLRRVFTDIILLFFCWLLDFRRRKVNGLVRSMYYYKIFLMFILFFDLYTKIVIPYIKLSHLPPYYILPKGAKLLIIGKSGEILLSSRTHRKVIRKMDNGGGWPIRLMFQAQTAYDVNPHRLLQQSVPPS